MLPKKEIPNGLISQQHNKKRGLLGNLRSKRCCKFFENKKMQQHLLQISKNKKNATEGIASMLVCDLRQTAHKKSPTYLVGLLFFLS